MKVISKLYVSDTDLTSMVIPYVENQEMLKDMEKHTRRTIIS